MANPRLPIETPQRLSPEPNAEEQVRPSFRAADDRAFGWSIVSGQPDARKNLADEFRRTGANADVDATLSSRLGVVVESSNTAFGESAVENIAKLDAQSSAAAPHDLDALKDVAIQEAVAGATEAKDKILADPMQHLLDKALLDDAKINAKDGEQQNQLDIAAARMGLSMRERQDKVQTTMSEMLESYAEGLDNGLFVETLTGVAYEAFPGVNLSDNLIQFQAYEAVTGQKFSDTAPSGFIDKLLYEGRDFTGEKVVGGKGAWLRNMLTGSARGATADWIAAQPLEERPAALQRFLDFLVKNDAKMTDATLRGMASRVGGQFLETGDPTDNFDDILEDGFAVLDATIVGGIAFKLGRMFRSLGRASYTHLSNSTMVTAKGINKAQAREETINTVNEAAGSRGTADIVLPEDTPPILLPHTNGSGANPRNPSGVTAQEIAASQLPKPFSMFGKEVNDDIQSEIIQDAARLRILEYRRTSGQEAAQRIPYHERPQDVQNAIELHRAEQAKLHKATIRPSMSTIDMPNKDGTQIDFYTVLGMDKDHGYSSLDTAVAEALRHSNDGSNVRIMSSDGLVTTEVMIEGGDMLGAMDNWRAGIGVPPKGDFYIQLKQTHNMSPTDRMLFGDEPQVTGVWLGRAGGYVLPPDARFTHDVYGKYVRAHMLEQSIVGNLDKIVAPIFKLSRPVRRQVGIIYDWMGEYALAQGRHAKKDEILEAFPDTTPEQFRGIYLVRKFNQALYDINNNRLYRDFQSQGYLTLRRDTPNGVVEYHGKKLRPQDLYDYKSPRATYTVLDPETMTPVVFDYKGLKTLEEQGGVVLEVPLTVMSKSGSRHTYILSTPQHGQWTLGELSEKPLKEILDYYPRMNEDTIYIQETKRVLVNGKMRDETQMVAVAPTAREGEAFITKGRAKNPDSTYTMTPDSRLSSKDTIGMDKERMQLEGRLFFDNRQDTRLPSTRGGYADTVDPVNMLHTSARIVANDVAMADLTKGMIHSWQESFGHLIDGDISTTKSSTIRGRLQELINASDGTPEDQLLAQHALPLWNHIMLMDGSINEGGKKFKKLAIESAEFLHWATSGIPAALRPSQYLYRNIHKVSPLESLKSLTFFKFMTAKPIRQLAMQASQHTMLLGLAPKYAVQWEKDNWSILLGTKRQAVELMGGKKMGKELAAESAATMKLTPQEYTKLLHEIDQSGAIQTVNIHSFHGDIPQQGVRTPQSTAGDVAQTAGRTVTAAPVREWLLAHGFDLGEQWNVVASYMMALHLYKQENSITNLLDITKAGWHNVDVSASSLAGSMHRANSFEYQRGAVSGIAQFMSHAHKMTLVTAQATLGKGSGAYDLSRGSGGAWKRREAATLILAGQTLIWGASATGGGALVSWGLQKVAEGIDPEGKLPEKVRTWLETAIAELAIEKSFELALAAAGYDENVKLDVKSVLAPMSGTDRFFQKFFDAAARLSPLESLAQIPSGNVVTSIFEHAADAQRILRVPDMPAEEKIGKIFVALASSVAGGLDDLLLAKTWHDLGELTNASGNRTGYKAKMSTILAKAWFGMSAEELSKSYELYTQVAGTQDYLDKVAKNCYEQLVGFTNLYFTGEDTKPDWNAKNEALSICLSSLEPEEVDYVHDKFWALDLKAPKTNIAEMLTKKATGGLPLHEVDEQHILNLGLSDEQTEIALRSIRENVKGLESVGTQKLKDRENND